MDLIPGIKSVLKCRGPVTPETRHVVYEVEIKEIGYRPEPYVIADAHMYADGHRIVMFKDMSLQMWGIECNEIESVWLKNDEPGGTELPVVFDHDRLREFCRGKPSKAFGNRYKIFDHQTFHCKAASTTLRLYRPGHIYRTTSLDFEAGWMDRSRFRCNTGSLVFQGQPNPEHALLCAQ